MERSRPTKKHQTYNPTSINTHSNPTGKPKELKKNKSGPPSPTHSSVIRSSALSQTGMVPDNPGKVNQDSFIEIHNFLDNPSCHLFGVFDGHGEFGKEISSLIASRLPFLLSNNRSFTENPQQIVLQSVEALQSEILRQKYDTTFSGSTMNLVLILGHKLYCFNIGDSRAVLGRLEGRKWATVGLSRDHKPDIEEEKKRIIASGGRVEPLKDDNNEPYGPPRVWVRNLEIPGIALSRTLGDSLAVSIGVVPVPEVTERDIKPEDKFIVIGSDGLFEFISNEEIVKFASNYVKCEPAAVCGRLVRVSNERWRKEEESVDDITCVCIFLNID